MADEHRAVEHERIAHFGEKNGELTVGGIPLTRLAARAGSTPFYAYDRSVLTARVGELRKALPREVELHYAMKANPMPALVGYMVGLVDGLDVASGGELRVALDAGADPQHVSIAGPGKSHTELEQAVAAGILVNVEAFREVDALAAIAERLQVRARIAVRVNPSFELKRAGMSMGGGAKQFGVDGELVPELLGKIARAGLAFEGFHLFAGSQSLNAEAIAEAQRLSFDLAVELAGHAPSSVRTLNLGGGFGIPYFPGERSLDLAPIASELRRIVADADTRLPQAKIVLELGRYLVGEAGVYVARIVDRKISRGRVFLVTDGGLHHHLSASGNFGQVVRKNFPVVIGTKLGSSETERANVVGPLCTPLDTLCSDMPLAKAEPGDLVVVFQSGAYGASASPQGFLSHPRVVEVLV